MGHVNQIAIAYKQIKNKNVVAIDGDGSIQMQLGNYLKLEKVTKIFYT